MDELITENFTYEYSYTDPETGRTHTALSNLEGEAVTSSEALETWIKFMKSAGYDFKKGVEEKLLDCLQ